MQLRDYQRRFVDRCTAALYEHRSALGVAPTGAGKTVMLSALIAEHGGTALVVQHREELLRQNRATFCRYTDTTALDHGLIGQGCERWRHVSFGMVMTLRNRLERMPAVDLLVIDEAHRARAKSYELLVEAVRERNPDALVFGVTATPDRGDKRGLGRVFRAVGDVLHIDDLIDAGYLVRPRAKVIGTTDWTDAPKTSTGEYDLRGIEAEVSVEVVMDEVLRHWQREAGDRQSVFFCPGVASAHAYAERLRMLGVTAAAVDGETPAAERARIFAELAEGRLQVLTNVFVATEGWDCPAVSCVTLLRPSSFKSTMVQMVGRGLRTAEGKEDCVVLDFGRSLQMHGDLQVIPRMKDAPKGDAPTKACPACEARVPVQVAVCPMCGFDFQAEADDAEKERIRLREVELREFRLHQERQARRRRECAPVWLEVAPRAMAACVSPGQGVVLCEYAGRMWLQHADSRRARTVCSWQAEGADLSAVLDEAAGWLLERVEAQDVDERFLRSMREWSGRNATASPKMLSILQSQHEAAKTPPPLTAAMTDAWTLIWFHRARRHLRAALLKAHNEHHREEDQRSPAP